LNGNKTPLLMNKLEVGGSKGKAKVQLLLKSLFYSCWIPQLNRDKNIAK